MGNSLDMKRKNHRIWIFCITCILETCTKSNERRNKRTRLHKNY